jgi:hypothetical protein
LIRWCLLALEESPVETMTKAEVRNDDRLEGHLQKLLRRREPERSLLIKEFWRRYAAGKDVAKILAGGSG